MKKKITKVQPMHLGNLMLEFEDGSKQCVNKGDHERHKPEVGDAWPPDGHAHVETGVYAGKLQRTE